MTSDVVGERRTWREPGFLSLATAAAQAGPGRLLELAAMLASATGEQQLADVTAALAGEATGARWGLVILTGVDGASAIVGETRSDTAVPSWLAQPDGPIATALAGRALHHAGPWEQSAFSAAHAAAPIGPLLGVPLQSTGRVTGGLLLARGGGEASFSRADKLHARSVGQLAGSLLEGLRKNGAASYLLDSLSLIGNRRDDPVPPSAITSATHASAVVRRLVTAARNLLGMQVVFLSRVDGDRQTFVAVDAAPGAPRIVEGSTIDLETGYCHLLLRGHLPNAVPDVPAHPLLGSLAITVDIGAGAYCGVPVTCSNGVVYGTLCGLNADPGSPPSLAHLQALSTIAALIAQRLDLETEQAARSTAQRMAFQDLIESSRSRILVQPIVRLEDGRVVGYEALSRFTDPHGAALSPEVVFLDARKLGMSIRLELAAVRAALNVLPRLPAAAYLSINLSPATLLDPAAVALLATAPVDRLVVEITEHELVTDYAAVSARLAPLRARGLRLAVDDTGAGYASLQHLVRLQPDVIKLDAAFIRDIDADPARRAITRAVAGFANEVGATLIAEGIETITQARSLLRQGVRHGQGYLFGRPALL